MNFSLLLNKNLFFLSLWFWWMNIVTVILTIALPGGSTKNKTQQAPVVQSSKNDLNTAEKKSD